MKKVYLDIETSPHVAYVWKLFDENIGLDQLITPTRVICLAWKFDDEPVQFSAEWNKGGHKRMVSDAYAVIEEADAIVHFNGASFDEPHLNREFLEYGYDPPAKPETIDLYRAIRSKFRFASNKLQHVSDVLELREGKIKTDFTLWSRVLDGDTAAQAEMERYNREDVELTKELYDELLPWIDKHPNVALYEGDTLMRCTHCASEDLLKDGFHRTGAGVFQRYRCRECGARSRGFKRSATTPLRESR